MKTRTKMLVSIAVSAIFAIGGISPATAAPSLSPTPSTTDTSYAAADAFLEQYGADTTTRERLMSTLKSGGTWDSLSSDNVAVNVVNSLRSDGAYTVSTYADGSISVVRIGDTPTSGSGGVIPMGVSQCSVSGASHNNCYISMWVGVVAMNFTASYNTSTNNVSNIYGAGWSIGGACSVTLQYLGIPVSNIGRMDLVAQMCVIGYSTTFWLQLKVTGGTPVVSWTA